MIENIGRKVIFKPYNRFLIGHKTIENLKKPELRTKKDKKRWPQKEETTSAKKFLQCI